jgi:RNA polymerase-binding transcription factor DksA
LLSCRRVQAHPLFFQSAHAEDREAHGLDLGEKGGAITGTGAQAIDRAAESSLPSGGKNGRRSPGWEADVEPELQEHGSQEKIVRFRDQMDTRLKVEIEVIDQALVRLSPGQYGLCEHCRGDISDARLQVLSATTLCVACAQARAAAEE